MYDEDIVVSELQMASIFRFRDIRGYGIEMVWDDDNGDERSVDISKDDAKNIIAWLQARTGYWL